MTVCLLQMFSSTSQVLPLAWLDRAASQTLNGRYVRTRLTLTIGEDAEHLMDHIVVACIVLEHELRMSDKRRDATIAGVGGYATPGVVKF